MLHYELRYARRVLELITEFDEEEWREIRRLCHNIIRQDPSIDNEHKLFFGRFPLVFTLYASPRFWIIYSVSNTIITVENIGRAGYSDPSPW